MLYIFGGEQGLRAKAHFIPDGVEGDAAPLKLLHKPFGFKGVQRMHSVGEGEAHTSPSSPNGSSSPSMPGEGLSLPPLPPVPPIGEFVLYIGSSWVAPWVAAFFPSLSGLAPAPSSSLSVPVSKEYISHPRLPFVLLASFFTDIPSTINEEASLE